MKGKVPFAASGNGFSEATEKEDSDTCPFLATVRKGEAGPEGREDHILQLLGFNDFLLPV